MPKGGLIKDEDRKLQRKGQYGPLEGKKYAGETLLNIIKGKIAVNKL